MTRRAACAAVALLATVAAAAAGFGMPGGPPPQNLEEIAALLRKDAYDLELLISYGTSKGGSAGHLALAIRDAAPGDDLVHSANFYADRAPEHAKDRYTEDLMVAIPKQEYLFGTTSTLGPKASFGLDFGEVYKRSVIGVRVYGVPAREKDALAAFFRRLNADFHARARNTAYHDGEVRYDYLRLNCAKTIGSAFRVGAGYRDLEVEGTALLPGRTRMVAASNANIPTEMAMKLLKAWDARGYGLDVVLYRKYDGSPYVDPLEEEKVAFRDLPNRFPSVLSRDFAKEAGQYQDYDNLFAMYLLHNLRRYEVRVNGAAGRLEVERRGEPMPYRDAVVAAKADAQADRDGFGRRQPFRKRGTPIGEAADGSQPAGRSGPGQPPRRAATALSDATAR